MAQVGNSAPQFTLKNTNREDVSLSQLQGKHVVGLLSSGLHGDL